MSTIQSVLKSCALAAPLLLLVQCTEGPSTPAAPVVSQVEAPPCLDYGDPERAVAMVHPLPGESICAGACEQIRWDVQNACGEWVAKIEGWYDGAYHPLGEQKMIERIAWATPPNGCACARLRVTVVDELGLVGTTEVLAPVVRARKDRSPIERD